MDRTLIWQLALRYLRGKRSANAVPVLSRISMVAIAVSSAAMIVVFSVFNGLEFHVKDMYRAFYPDVKISAARGKFFQLDDSKIAAIKKLVGVQHVSFVIQDNAFVNNSAQQKVIKLKGIDNEYFHVNDVHQFIDMEAGADSVSAAEHTALMGARIKKELGADINNIFSAIELQYINPTATNPELDPASAFSSIKLHPAGVFHVGDEFDGDYVLAALPLAQELYFAKDKYSSIEISTGTANADDIRTQIQQIVGSSYNVETRYEQNKSVYAILSMEKWAIYFILLFIMLIASFNFVGALSMLVLEKQKDIAILRAMGAQQSAIRRIFLLEGVLWSFVGAVAGIALGSIIVLVQQFFGLIAMPGSFALDAFPVKLSPPDMALVFVTVLAVSLLTAWYPAMRATKVSDPTLKAS